MADIVYLEDEEQIARFVKAGLEREGHSVAYEACAQTLLERIESEMFAPGTVYLLDNTNIRLTNPRPYSGSDVALRVLEHDPTARIILGTGNALEDLPLQIQTGVQRGHIGYLKKPFRMAALQDIVHEYSPIKPKHTEEREEDIVEDISITPYRSNSLRPSL